ncbi:hypothetical protein BP6252_14157 [Coleophoma cylindrospora]|uniref:Uncharacterized protein n=1 Tax=Coleophoma cylindrospora TaxID=1849047 RepID=A0A3D8Q3F5_9HELO|nr:hypothetical protein BP6252_14157 [Coleophoma cylindrospora]
MEHSKQPPYVQACEVDDEPTPANLPPYDKATSTRLLCLVGVFFSYVLALIMIAGAVVVIPSSALEENTIGGFRQLPLSSEAIKAVPLLFNILITLCTESLSYVHAISLRWALYHEGRLHFNSNLRLFTNAKSSAANTRFANVAAAICLIVSYTGASQTFTNLRDSSLYVNGTALLMLGIGLLVLSIISTISFCHNRARILSWSPNPINTALACAQSGLLVHRPGRAMMPVQATNSPAQPTAPSSRQKPMNSAYQTANHVVRFLFFMFLFCFALGVILVVVDYTTNRLPGLSFFPNGGGLQTQVLWYWGLHAPGPLQLFVVMMFGSMMQAFIVMVLHCAELLINVWRDESAWRNAYQAKGAAIKIGALQSATSSIPWFLLFIFKPVAQWIFGSVAIVIQFPAIMIEFAPLPFLVLSAMALVLAIFGRAIAMKHHKGPQPATYGHLQTLVDLIDDWSMDEDGRLWWGSKGNDNNQIGSAGTCDRKDGVGCINIGQLYS